MDDYKKLENSIVSNPDEMYVENSDEKYNTKYNTKYDKEYKTTIFDKLKIVTNYLGNCEDDANSISDTDDAGDTDEVDNDRSISTVFIDYKSDIKSDVKSDVKSYVKSDVKSDVKQDSMTYLEHFTNINVDYLECPNDYLPNYPGQYNITSDNFFEYFDEEKSINNVVACSHHEDFCKDANKISDISSSYLFDRDQSILPDKDSPPFETYDQEGYQKDKIKYKKQKSINRLGVVTFSTVVVMGSAWINSFINS
jgi:hypothetical protein